MASERTKKAKGLKLLFGALHFLCLLGPFLYFIPYAFVTGEMVSKLAISFSVTIALIIALISLIVEAKNKAGLHRSILWILVIGLLFCLDSIKPFIWIIGGLSLADELVFSKLRDHYATVHATNKEIDRAMNK